MWQWLKRFLRELITPAKIASLVIGVVLLLIKDRFAGWANAWLDEQIEKHATDILLLLKWSAQNLHIIVWVIVGLLVIFILLDAWRQTKKEIKVTARFIDAEIASEYTSIADAITYIRNETEFGTLLSPITPADEEHIQHRILDELRKAVLNGDIHVHGKHEHNGDTVQIPTDYWVKMTFDVAACVTGTKDRPQTKMAKDITLSVDEDALSKPRYYNIQINREELERRFPLKPLRTSDETPVVVEAQPKVRNTAAAQLLPLRLVGQKLSSRSIETDDALAAWKTQVSSWRQDVIKILKKDFSERQSFNFQDTGQIQPSTNLKGAYNEQHYTLREEIKRQVGTLDEILK